MVRDREGAGAVRGVAAVDEGAQGLVQIQVGALDPVGELLVGEAVAASRGDEEALGEHGRCPAGAAAQPGRGRSPREQSLEGLPVQSALPGTEAAPGRLVDLPGDLGREASHGRAVQAVLPGQAGGDAQTHQVQVRREDRVPGDGDRGRDSGEGGADLREQAEGEGVSGIRFRQDAVRHAVPCARLAGLVAAQVGQADAGREPGGRAGHRLRPRPTGGKRRKRLPAALPGG